MATYTNESGLTLEEILLGQYVSEQVNKTDQNFKALSAETDEIRDEIKTVKNEAHKSETFDTIPLMVDTLNGITDQNTAKNKYHIGDNFFIKDTGVPDFWLSGYNSSFVTGNANTFATNDYHNCKVGWFILDKLETQEVDLSNSVTTDENALATNEIILGAGDKKVKKSGKKIVETMDGKAESVPTSKAVRDEITNAQTSFNNSINNIVNGTTIVGKAKMDRNGNVIDETYATKAELATAGKVQDVTVNGTSVVNDKGVAVITIADLKAGFVDITPTDSRWLASGLTLNGKVYQAIAVEETNTALGVFNSSGQEMVIQIAHDTTNKKLYLCIGSEKITCSVRVLSGGAVGVGGSSGKYLHTITLYWQEVANYNNSHGTVTFNIVNTQSAKYTNAAMTLSALGSAIKPASGTMHTKYIVGDDQNDDFDEQTLWITGINGSYIKGISSMGKEVDVPINDMYYKLISTSRMSNYEEVVAL